ncbi:MAG: hypothetical protein WCY43_01420 [Patescibacteria group bacterium]|nr:hypothetical protein [Patescibacteria group bacterium]
MKNKKSLVLLIISFFTIFLMSTPVMASIVPGAGQRSADYESGNYELNDILLVGIQVTRFILGIVGSLSLLFFVYGGVMFLISAGSSDKVQQAKTIIINATIGLIIVFTSYIIIEFAMSALGVNWGGTSSVITRLFD